MLQLYGNPKSRAMRCLWMLEEMGEPYQLIEKSTRTDELHSADYVRLNPNARIPTLVDGDHHRATCIDAVNLKYRRRSC
jgi:glutathione S-transferase